MSRHINFKETLSVVLRVPAFFMAEAWYRTDPRTMQRRYMDMQGKLVQPPEILFFGLYYSAIVLALTLMTLPLKRLVHLYLYVISGLLMVIAHHLSSQFVHWELTRPADQSIINSREHLVTFALYIMVQGVLSIIIAYLLSLGPMMRLLFMLLYTAPMIGRACNLPIEELSRIQNCSTCAAVVLFAYFMLSNIPHLLEFARASFQQLSTTVQVHGWISFIITLCFNLLLPIQLLTFWLTLFVIQLQNSQPIQAEGWIVVMLADVSECCLTPVSLLGLCVTVSYISYMILMLTKLFLQGWAAFAQDNILHQGWTEGFTMFLLALQTGIIDLDSPERAILMSIILFIVVSSLIQSMYEITDPLLMALGASKNKHVSKHVRAIVMCTLLWITPLYMTSVICEMFDMDFWLLVVVSSCVLTSVQVIGALAVYLLLIYDAILVEPWHRLDDVIYYVKASTRILEFIVALFVVGYGVNASLFDEWSFVNTSILIVHCYFNVWQRLQVGWKTYLQRRETAKMIESLPEASQDQLEEHCDVCPICLLDMQTALLTPCRHFFHRVCIKKWLYVNEHCPLCHEKLNAEKIHPGKDNIDTNFSSQAQETDNIHANTAVPSQGVREVVSCQNHPSNSDNIHEVASCQNEPSSISDNIHEVAPCQSELV